MKLLSDQRPKKLFFTPLMNGSPMSCAYCREPARVVVQVWDSEEQIQKWRSSADYKKAREMGDKIAKFCSYAVPGTSQ